MHHISLRPARQAPESLSRRSQRDAPGGARGVRAQDMALVLMQPGVRHILELTEPEAVYSMRGRIKLQREQGEATQLELNKPHPHSPFFKSTSNSKDGQPHR